MDLVLGVMWRDCHSICVVQVVSVTVRLCECNFMCLRLFVLLALLSLAMKGGGDRVTRHSCVTGIYIGWNCGSVTVLLWTFENGEHHLCGCMSPFVLLTGWEFGCERAESMEEGVLISVFLMVDLWFVVVLLCLCEYGCYFV